MEPWQLKIRELREGFQELQISQIEEFNTLTDTLSIEELVVEIGVLLANYFVDNFLVSEEVLQIFRSLQYIVFWIILCYKKLKNVIWCCFEIFLVL